MRVRKNTKFGISIPATYNEGVELDRTNSNKYGQDATKKKTKNSEVALKFLDDGRKLSIGFKRITCHLIFDVKFT